MSKNGEDRAYVRVSTLKDSQKDSPEHQESFIKSHAKYLGKVITRVYEDRGTATSIIEREDVQQMIEDAKRGEIRTLFFASLSRFSRDFLDAVSLKRILVNALKVRVVSIEDGYDSGIKDDELLFNIKAAVNQNTSGDISVSSRRGIKQSAESGNYIGSIAPYGYKKVTIDDPRMKSGKRKTLEVIPEKAEVIRTIFDLYVNEGMGEKSIVKYLNGEDGLRDPIPSYKGGLWGLTSVQAILRNENYTGYTVYGRHTTEVTYNDLSNLMDRGKKQVLKPRDEWQKTDFQTHEAIISKELYDAAQDIRLLRGGGERGGRRSYVNVFAKIIFCKECGSAMVTMGSKRDNGNDYRYLMCSRRRRMGATGCNNGKWIPYYDFRDDIIELIIKRLGAELYSLSESGTEKISPESPVTRNPEKEKEKLDKLIETNRKLLFEVRRQKMLGELSDDQYEYEKEQYEKEIVAAEKKKSILLAEEKRMVDKSKVTSSAKSVLAKLSEMESYDDIEKTRALVVSVVNRIEVDREGETSMYLYLRD